MGRDGKMEKSTLPIKKLPKEVSTFNFWIHDEHLYFSGPAVWNGSYYKSEIQRHYIHDVRVNKWDFPDWNNEWGKYSNHHYYYDRVEHIFCEKILSKNGNIFRTKHCLVKCIKN